MKTKDLSEIQLHKYFDEHVRYEVQMLLNATGAILKQTPISQELQYMPIESYAIHLRNIITFLYPFSRRDTDVCANDFFIDKSSWLEVRPKISEILKTAKDRADKEVGHLTTSRLSGTPEKKKWNVKAMTGRTCLLSQPLSLTSLRRSASSAYSASSPF